MAAFPLLIPLQKAKSVCRVTGTDDDERIDEFRKAAQKIVIDYCKVADDYWDVALPLHVDSAMKLVLINLYEGEPPLSDAVIKLLERARDPALA